MRKGGITKWDDLSANLQGCFPEVNYFLSGSLSSWFRVESTVKKRRTIAVKYVGRKATRFKSFLEMTMFTLDWDETVNVGDTSECRFSVN